MTREQKIAKARELRGKGWTARQIAIRLDAPESTVRNWYLGGTCRCGAPLDGSSPGRATGRCPKCVAADSTVWTRGAIVAAIRNWTRRYGEVPSASDWNPGVCKSLLASTLWDRWESDDWPPLSTVQKRFGSWNTAIRAAGFVPRPSSARGPDRTPMRRRAAA